MCAQKFMTIGPEHHEGYGLERREERKETENYPIEERVPSEMDSNVKRKETHGRASARAWRWYEESSCTCIGVSNEKERRKGEETEQKTKTKKDEKA
jgi:hypothetical protein